MESKKYGIAPADYKAVCEETFRTATLQGIKVTQAARKYKDVIILVSGVEIEPDQVVHLVKNYLGKRPAYRAKLEKKYGIRYGWRTKTDKPKVRETDVPDMIAPEKRFEPVVMAEPVGAQISFIPPETNHAATHRKISNLFYDLSRAFNELSK